MPTAGTAPSRHEIVTGNNAEVVRSFLAVGSVINFGHGL